MFYVFVRICLIITNTYIANAYTWGGEHKQNVLYFIKYMSWDVFYLYFII